MHFIEIMWLNWCEILLYGQLGDADAVRALLAAGADPGVHNKEAQTALDLATSPKVGDVFSQEMLQSIAQSK